MEKIPWVEIAAVTAVGVVLSYAVRKAPIVKLAGPVALGAGLYTLGYMVRGTRPAGGWPQLQG